MPRRMNLYMSAETERDFELVREAWGMTGEREQGQVIARALSEARERVPERPKRARNTPPV